MPKAQWMSKDLWIIGAGFAAAMHIGKLPAAIPVLQAELGISFVQSGLLLSLVQGAGMCFAMLLGSYVEKIGLKKCILIGLALLTFASTWAAYQHSLTILFSMRVLEGFGFLLVTLSAPALIRQLVPAENLSAKMGLWTAYMGGGMGVALLTAPMLMQHFNWQTVWMTFASVTAAFFIAILLAVPQPKKSMQPVQVKSLIAMTLSHAPAWLLALIFGTYAGQWFALVGFLPSIYEQSHIAPTMAGIFTASVSIANAFGTFACGLLLQRGFKAKTLVQTGFAVLLFCALSFYMFKAHLPFIAQFALVFNFSLWGGLVAANVFAQAFYAAPNPAAISTTIGLILQISAISQFVIPPCIAWLVTASGSWSAAGITMAVLSAAGIILSAKLFSGAAMERRS
jgi:cyanate permease